MVLIKGGKFRMGGDSIWERPDEFPYVVSAKQKIPLVGRIPISDFQERITESVCSLFRVHL